MPILRAGLGMLDGVLDTIPNAKVSVVGIARNHATLQPEPYVDRLAGSLHERTAIVLDPMLATGGSMISAITLLKSRGATDIRALVLVAAPEGIAALTAAHPDVRCWTAAIDSHLDAQRLHHPRPRRRRRSHLRHALSAHAAAPARQTQPSAPTTAPKPTSHIGLMRVRSMTAIATAISASAPSAMRAVADVGPREQPAGGDEQADGERREAGREGAHAARLAPARAPARREQRERGRRQQRAGHRRQRAERAGDVPADDGDEEHVRARARPARSRPRR